MIAYPTGRESYNGMKIDSSGPAPSYWDWNTGGTDDRAE
ncbi:MAG: hypothetical protein CM15mP6_0920 [Methanobacteriota archaeon]|nr:MAG: hypothetical protein CM15mP6_0920 [Euryarchaeota archaeon]